MNSGRVIACVLGIVPIALAAGQTPAGTTNADTQPASSVEQRGSQPIYRVTVVSRTTKAINYGHRTEPTKIDFKGTVLMPNADGEATVQSRRGAMEIDAKFNRLEAPTKFGSQYLTYVLWAISPEGRPERLGEVVPNGSEKAHLKTSTGLQSFALIVTAEPYFAVAKPSDAVVMENAVRSDTVGKVEEVQVKYELMPRRPFVYDKSREPLPSAGPKVSMDEYEAILALYQAQNAIEIARSEGADKYATDTFQRAQDLYQQAQTYRSQKAASKQIVATAREAAQAAEDARMIASKRQESSQQLAR